MDTLSHNTIDIQNIGVASKCPVAQCVLDILSAKTHIFGVDLCGLHIEVAICDLTVLMYLDSKTKNPRIINYVV